MKKWKGVKEGKERVGKEKRNESRALILTLLWSPYYDILIVLSDFFHTLLFFSTVTVSVIVTSLVLVHNLDVFLFYSYCIIDLDF